MYRLSSSLTATGAPAEPDWGQGLDANYPSLPDLSNPGAFLSVSSRSSQFSIADQQDFASSQAGLSGVPAFGNQSLDFISKIFSCSIIW